MQALIAGVSSYVVLLILGVPFRVPLGVGRRIRPHPSRWRDIGSGPGRNCDGVRGFSDRDDRLGRLGDRLPAVETNVLQPRIQSRAVDVQPFVVLVAGLFGSTLFGVIGALLALPLAASIQILIREILRCRRSEAAVAITT